MSKQHFVSVEESVMTLLLQRVSPWLADKPIQEYILGDLDANSYSCTKTFKKDYLTSSFLRKWKGLNVVGLNPTSKALSAWLEAERQCFQTNRRLELECSTGIYSVAPSIILGAQRKIRSILGLFNEEVVAQLCRFGNGATYDLRRGCTHSDKSLNPSITLDCIPLACKFLAGDEYMQTLVGGFRDIKIVDSNRMVMVPKTAKTHRVIAAEPTLNSYVQQGFGRYLRSRLKRFGVDLDDQTVNQDLASRAHIEDLSTIDLSSASDTLCTNLVKLLLPDDWYRLFDLARCKSTEYKKRRFLNSKFSSMGNAYTFELESMIFYALVEASCTKGVSSVYGDDIVVHSDDYPAVVKTLTWAGFIINGSKSFTRGSRFFESCGKHFLDGEDVTPCYQKDVCSRPHDYVRLHNRLYRAAIRLDLRDEVFDICHAVRALCRVRFGKDGCPGVGPLVEYDEYFIKEDYSWDSPFSDSVRIRSAVTVSKVVNQPGYLSNIAYYGRKLRSPGFLNPAHNGWCSESLGPKLVVIDKYHWRSATTPTRVPS